MTRPIPRTWSKKQMKIIMGKAKSKKTFEEVKAGATIEFTEFGSAATTYTLKATSDVVDVNPGNLMQFNGEITSGQLSSPCTARYMSGEGTVIAQIQ